MVAMDGEEEILASKKANELRNKYKDQSLSEKKKRKILDELKKRVGDWYNFFSENIQSFITTKEFFSGTQWNEYERSNMSSRGTEPFVFNLLKPLTRQIIGEFRNMQPGLDAISLDNTNVNPKMIKFYSDVVRYIAFNANTKALWSDDVLINLICGGWAVVEVFTDYKNNYSFDQDIYLEGKKEPHMCGFDPLAREKTKTDGEYCFDVTFMRRDDFERMWPDATPVTGPGFIGVRTYIATPQVEFVTVISYCRREKIKRTLVQLSNNRGYTIEVFEEDIDRAQAQYYDMLEQQGVPMVVREPLEIVNKRKTWINKICRYLCTSEEVLEYKTLECDDLPLIFIDYYSEYNQGRQTTFAYITDAMDAQKKYNWCMSEFISRCHATRKETIIGTDMQFAGKEHIYRNPEQVQGPLTYNPDPLADGKPMVIQPTQVPEYFLTLAQQAYEEIQRILGLYDLNRGEIPNQTSGVAIGRGIAQGNNTLKQLFYQVFDGMQGACKIIGQMIGRVYDSARLVKTLNPSGQLSTQEINNQGSLSEYRFDELNVEMNIKPVPAFSIQNEVMMNFMVQMLQVIPNSAPRIADLLPSLIEHPLSGELVQRFQLMLSPDVVAQEKGQPPPPPPPDPQMMLAQAQIAKTQAETQKIKVDAATKAQQMQMDGKKHFNEMMLEAEKLDIAHQKQMLDFLQTQIKANAEIHKARLDTTSKVMSKFK